jgi:hypothetical protein
MPIQGPRYAFSAWSITAAPADAGVYVLWEREELVYIGRTQNILGQLLQHYARHVAPHDATHYGWELARFPALREAELLREWQALAGKLPRHNGAA